jgi:hypothetical protein
MDSQEIAGWVVQVTIPAPKQERQGIPASPTFQFFNVAVPLPEGAIEAARKKINAPSDASLRVVRALSASEISFIRLRGGETKPA